MSNQKYRKTGITIAVVGDVHEQWEAADEEALKHLGVDLVLLVGDFGNESVPIVRAIAALDLPKAVALGNHDAWYTATPWGRNHCPYDRASEDWVNEQLDLLGETHVGYGKLDFPDLGLTVVGTRPFSWGGPEWKYGDFYGDRYGVNNFAESTAQIMQAVEAAQFDTLIFLGHNGPTGLGDRPEDPCGRDWKPLGGDFGDPDFGRAIGQSRALGKTIPLVTFGHMHHTLRHTKQQLRKSLHVCEDGTVYLNAARVPRIVQTDTHKLRNFSLVELHQGVVRRAALVWVDEHFHIVSEEVLYCDPAEAVVQLA